MTLLEILKYRYIDGGVGWGGGWGRPSSIQLFSMEVCCQRLGATAAILLTKLESSKSDLLAKVVESTSEIYRYAEVLSKQKNLD